MTSSWDSIHPSSTSSIVNSVSCRDVKDGFARNTGANSTEIEEAPVEPQVDCAVGSDRQLGRCGGQHLEGRDLDLVSAKPDAGVGAHGAMDGNDRLPCQVADRVGEGSIAAGVDELTY